MKLLLFDIDGTILLSGGAGYRGMTKSFHELYGVESALKRVTLSGMTDPLIFRQAGEHFNIPFDEEAHQAFKTRYLELMKDEIQLDGKGKRLMQGIVEILEALKKEDSVVLGLLTGN